jgi:hypothetical protein
MKNYPIGKDKCKCRNVPQTKQYQHASLGIDESLEAIVRLMTKLHSKKIVAWATFPFAAGECNPKLQGIQSKITSLSRLDLDSNKPDLIDMPSRLKKQVSTSSLPFRRSSSHQHSSRFTRCPQFVVPISFRVTRRLDECFTLSSFCQHLLSGDGVLAIVIGNLPPWSATVHLSQ